MGKTAAGRMINQDIALSAKVADLTPEALALFCLLIPHFSSHGKMLANPHAIKGNVCPLVEWLTVEKVEACLTEISDKTNVKWWRDSRGLHYLHSLNWKDHQSLREDRLGPDHLPDYPGEDKAIPGVVRECSGTNPAKGKGREVEVKGRKEKPSSDALRLSERLANLIAGNNPSNRNVQGDRLQATVERWAQDIDKMIRLDNRTPEEAEVVIEWCQQDTFWSANILSGAKLRNKFDQLQVKMERDTKKPQAGDSVLVGRRVY